MSQCLLVAVVVVLRLGVDRRYPKLGSQDSSHSIGLSASLSLTPVITGVLYQDHQSFDPSKVVPVT